MRLKLVAVPTSTMLGVEWGSVTHQLSSLLVSHSQPNNILLHLFTTHVNLACILAFLYRLHPSLAALLGLAIAGYGCWLHVGGGAPTAIVLVVDVVVFARVTAHWHWALLMALFLVSGLAELGGHHVFRDPAPPLKSHPGKVLYVLTMSPFLFTLFHTMLWMGIDSDLLASVLRESKRRRAVLGLK